MDFLQKRDHLEECSVEGPMFEEGPNAVEVALVAHSAYHAISSAEIKIYTVTHCIQITITDRNTRCKTNKQNLHVLQTTEERCGQQEIFLSDSLLIPLLCGHQEAHLVSPQPCHRLVQQEAHSLKKSMTPRIKSLHPWRATYQKRYTTK